MHNQFWFAECIFTRRPIRPPWTNAEIRPQKMNSQITVLAGAAADLSKSKIEIIVDEQGQGAFKTTEREGGEKENQNEQTDFGLRERVSPLRETRTVRNGRGIWLPAFDEDEIGEEKIQRAQRRRRPARASWSKSMKYKLQGFPKILLK
jgi:hypothetical protein